MSNYPEMVHQRAPGLPPIPDPKPVVRDADALGRLQSERARPAAIPPAVADRPTIDPDAIPGIPPAPHLTPEEIASAIRGGGIVGLLRAYRRAVADPSPELVRALGKMEHMPGVSAIGVHRTNYRKPNDPGMIAHSDYVANVARQVLVAEIVHTAMLELLHHEILNP